MTKKATNLSSLTRWLRDYRVLSRYRTQWLLAALFLLLAAGATLTVPLAFRNLVDTGLTSQAINQQFINLLILAAVLAVMTSCRYYVMSWLGERVVADSANASLKTSCAKALLTLKPCKLAKCCRG